jgi:3-hydroxyacyl-[acyl-carrier-protein] dehydratase
MKDINQVLKVLPHRYPFVLIDRMLEFHEGSGPGRVGRKVKALKNVTYNEPYFPGHFPHRPVMPGVLILEAMAQASIFAVYIEGGPALDVAIARISEIRFHKPVVPGDQLILDVEILKDRGQMVLMKLRSSVNGETIAETEMLASITSVK